MAGTWEEHWVSQPWQETSRAGGRPGSARSAPMAGTADAWSPGPAEDSGAAPGGPVDLADPAAETGAPERPAAAASRQRAKLTGRGAIAVMFVLFFTGLLVSAWLHLGVLAGASFLAGTVVAAWYTKQRDLLTVAVSPPLLFFFALVGVKALTATGSTALSTVEGTALTLANVAPWLFAGMLLSLIIAWRRGLRRCVADLRRDLRPDLAKRRSAGPSGPGAYRPAKPW
jgi:hypothetical protein